MSAVDPPRKAGISDYLAAERTLLAWIRTGLALMGFGFVLARFGFFLQQIEILHPTRTVHSYGFSLWFGTLLIAVGVMVNAFAGWRHLRLVKDLDNGATFSSRTSIHAVAITSILSLIGLAMVVYLVSISS